MAAHVIETLRREHRTLAGLLDALERQVGLFAGGEAPDYDVVRGVADYLLDYPDRCHHPKEDIVFARLSKVNPREAAAVGELPGEHRDLRRAAERFAVTVSVLLNDLDIPRQTVVEAATAYIDAQRRHMWREEERFFPLAERLLTAGDWAAIEGELAQRRGTEKVRRAEAEAARISERLLTWEREDEGPRASN